jgi:hypothetical protein
MKRNPEIGQLDDHAWQMIALFKNGPAEAVVTIAKEVGNRESFHQGYLFCGTIWGQPIHHTALDEYRKIPISA